MKKFLLLFDETTIVNLGFIWRLLKRYSYITLSILVLTSVYTAYSFWSQPLKYVTEVSFKVVSPDKSRGSNDLMVLLGESSFRMELAEISALMDKWDFKTQLANNLIIRDDFAKLHFDLNSNSVKKQNSILKSCDQESLCMERKIASIIGAFFRVENTSAMDTYRLKVITLDPHTSKVILEEGLRTMNEHSISSTRKVIDAKIKRAESMFVQKEEDILEKGASKHLEQKSLYGIQLSAKKEQLRSITMKLDANESELNNLKLRLKHYTQNLSQNQVSSKKSVHRHYDQMRQRLLKLRNDRQAISSEGVNEDNKWVLKTLNTEIERLESTLRASKGQNGRSFAAIQKLLAQQEGESEKIRVDIKVLTDNIEKITAHGKEIEKEVRELGEKVSEESRKVEGLKPDLEYLKLIKGKMVSLQLLGSMVVSEFEFGKPSLNVSVFKPKTLTFTILGGLLVFVLISFIFILVRYLFDDTLYEEDEINHLFDNLGVIGQAPEFEE